MPCCPQKKDFFDPDPSGPMILAVKVYCFHGDDDLGHYPFLSF